MSLCGLGRALAPLENGGGARVGIPASQANSRPSSSLSHHQAITASSASHEQAPREAADAQASYNETGASADAGEEAETDNDAASVGGTARREGSLGEDRVSECKGRQKSAEHERGQVRMPVFERSRFPEMLGDPMAYLSDPLRAGLNSRGVALDGTAPKRGGAKGKAAVEASSLKQRRPQPFYNSNSPGAALSPTAERARRALQTQSAARTGDSAFDVDPAQSVDIDEVCANDCETGVLQVGARVVTIVRVAENGARTGGTFLSPCLHYPKNLTNHNLTLI